MQGAATCPRCLGIKASPDMDMPALPAGPAARQLAIAPPAARTVPPEMPMHVQTMDQLTTPRLREKFMALKRELQRTQLELVTV